MYNINWSQKIIKLIIVLMNIKVIGRTRDYKKQINEIPSNSESFYSYLTNIFSIFNENSFDIIKSVFQQLREKDVQLLKKVVMDSQKLQLLMQSCQNLGALALLMNQHHLYFQIETYDYGPKLFKLLVKRIETLMEDCLNQIFFSTFIIDEFLMFKSDNNKTNIQYKKIDSSVKKAYDAQIFFMIEFLIIPIFDYGIKLFRQKYLENFTTIIKWMLFISDEDDIYRSNLLWKFSRVYLTKLCPSLLKFNNIISLSFKMVLDCCQIPYNQNDSFQVSPNLFLFINNLNPTLIKELIQIWYASIKKQNFNKEMFQNLFLNLLDGTLHLNCLKIIDLISKQLQTHNEFQILFHLNEKVIKRSLIKYKFLKEEEFRLFLNIVLFYVVGFINIDRFQDEQEIIVNNYWSKLLVSDINQLHKEHHLVLRLLHICDNRFHNSTKITRNVVRELQKIFKSKFDIAQIYQIIHRDMFQLNSSEQKNQFGHAKSSSRYRGLLNIGNTCYMSSFIQALYMTKKFRNLIFEQLKIEDDKRAANAIYELFTQLSKREFSKSQNSIAPYRFKRFLPQPFNKSVQQQDSTEFGRLYLSYLVQDYKISNQGMIIEELFFNSTELQLSCSVCNTVTKNSQKLFDFILSFKEQAQFLLISNLLTDYFKKQELTDDNLIYCEKCKTNRRKSAHRVPIYFAPYLVITLNRFKYLIKQKTKTKLFNLIQFEFQLQLKNIIGALKDSIENTKYDLYAFIVHIGQFSEGGHYVVYARNIQQNANIWYLFDDSYVTEHQIMTFEDFNLGQNQTPYMLFYASQTGHKVTIKNEQKKQK